MFLSRVDKQITNAFYEIELNDDRTLPVRIHVTVLTGRKGATLSKGAKITGGEHVAFHFEYTLSKFDELESPEVPPEALTRL